nr:hypothetical protein [uncultured Sellimonas sp.]
MKNIAGKIIILGCAGMLLVGMDGCEKQKEKQDKTVLNVITDPSIQKEVNSIADFMMKTEEIEIKVKVLPSKEEGRDSEIQKLQTQIMAGKGADVYLLDTSPDAAEMKTELFANPYQTMQSGVLAPLDKYMETDSYWEDTTYNEKILNAGQYDGKQYMIPLSCYYYVLSGTNDIENITGDTLGEWLEQAEQLDDSGLKEAINGSLYLTSGRWFQPAADYEAQQVLFDKEKWATFAKTYMRFRQEEIPDAADNMEEQYQIQPVRSFIGGEEAFAKIIPDLEGRKMASIMTYGAVGMSSDQKEEAYEFLMLFLNDKIKEEGSENVDQVLSGSAGIAVEKNEIKNWLSDRSEATISSVEESFEELDGAYFITDAERAMISNIRETVEWGIEPDNGWDKFLSDLADKVWKQYEMQVKE